MRMPVAANRRQMRLYRAEALLVSSCTEAQPRRLVARVHPIGQKSGPRNEEIKRHAYR